MAGHGDSIGVGLAALISGGDRFVGLDILPFSYKSALGYPPAKAEQEFQLDCLVAETLAAYHSAGWENT